MQRNALQCKGNAVQCSAIARAHATKKQCKCKCNVHANSRTNAHAMQCDDVCCNAAFAKYGVAT
eukprot:6342352-Lingulodinium_polyedra.AAC.1